MLTGYLGIDFEPVITTWMVCSVIPITLATLLVLFERNKFENYALNPWWLWSFGGAIMFGLWSGGYFLVGMLTDSNTVHYIEPVFDAFVPFKPYWVFIYLGVYPMFLVPFLYAKSTGTLIRTIVGYLTLMAISYSVFMAWPVAFYDRPVLGQPPADYARWVLSIVYGQDPPWNCLPSTHCAMALLSALAIYETGRGMGIWALLSALGIGVSTLFTKQHYAIDVLVGYLLAGITYWILHWIWKNPEKLPDSARRFIDNEQILAQGSKNRQYEICEKRSENA